ncbi:MAG: right-handed parallel beta-helix repeat-containing protein [Deltaproteobacteria bacterium]|nr:right-handed parallel beta-helix repeat-containing protein [Deltaproteobacteria bacterium]
MGNPAVRLAVPLLTAAALLAAPWLAGATVHVVRTGESIQAAVSTARPGDTVLVKPGLYAAAPGRRSVVSVTTDDLTLIGSLGAVIDASGADYGVLVGPDLAPHRQGCPTQPAVTRFRMQRAAEAGARLVGVEHYRLSHAVYLENGAHGASALCSRHGRIDHNFASDHAGASIHADGIETLRADHNIVKNSGLGIEIANSLNAVVHDNWITGNSGGVLVIARAGQPLPFTENVSVEHNWIAENNRPDASGELPVGTGILNIGGDDVLIRENTVIGNASFGVASFGNPSGALDPRIEPFVDGLVVKRNIVKRNGNEPDTARLATPAADLIFVPDVLDFATGHRVATDPDPTDNCFSDNHIDSDLPSGITSRFECP